MVYSGLPPSERVGAFKTQINMDSKFELFRQRAFKILSAAGFDVQNTWVSQYELILEAELKNVFDRVAFTAIGYRGAREFITEIRLQQQDVFICNEWGLFLLNTDAPSDIKFEEHTYPDREYFDKESAEEADIFYNADLSFVVNNLVVHPGVRTDKFKRFISVDDRKELGISGLVEMEDNYLILTGSKNIYFNLDLPRKTDWKDSTMRLRLRLRGLLCMNACIIT
jgi:hypothetical protein